MERQVDKEKAKKLKSIDFVRIVDIVLYEDKNNLIDLLEFLKIESVKEDFISKKKEIFVNKIVTNEVYNLFFYFHKALSSNVFIDDIEELETNNIRKEIEFNLSKVDIELRKFLDNNLLRSVRVGSILNFITLISTESSIHLSVELSEKYKLLTKEFSGIEYSTDETNYKKSLSNSERVKISLKIRDFGERCFIFFCDEIKKNLEMQNA